MALLQDLIRQINDPTLRDRILQETDKLMKQKKFGLVFEELLLCKKIEKTLILK